MKTIRVSDSAYKFFSDVVAGMNYRCYAVAVDRTISALAVLIEEKPEKEKAERQLDPESYDPIYQYQYTPSEGE